jgi:ankyrin repeat protein
MSTNNDITTTTTTTTNNNNLPYELWHQIFSFLTATELCRVAQVDRAFHQITRDNYLWRIACGSASSCVAATTRIPRLPTSWFAHVRSIHKLVRCTPRFAFACSTPTTFCYLNLRARLVADIANHCRELEHRRIINAHYAQISAAASMTPTTPPDTSTTTSTTTSTPASTTVINESDSARVRESIDLWQDCKQILACIDRQDLEAEESIWHLLEHTGIICYPKSLRQVLAIALECGCARLVQLIGDFIGAAELQINNTRRFVWRQSASTHLLASSIHYHPLSVAIYRNDIVMFHMLLALKADPNVHDAGQLGRVPLICNAASASSSHFVRCLIESKHVDASATDAAGNGILHYAARYGNADLIRYLCTAELPPSMLSGWHDVCSTATATATTITTTTTTTAITTTTTTTTTDCNSHTTVRLLTHVIGANKQRLRNRQHENPLHSLLRSSRYHGLREQSFQELMVLDSWQELLNEADHSHLTPAHLALRWASIWWIRTLHHHGARFDVPNQQGRNALHIAIHYGRTAPILDTLLTLAPVAANGTVHDTVAKRQAQLVNQCAGFGNADANTDRIAPPMTPLYMAAKRYQLDNVRLLLSYRPNSRAIPTELRGFRARAIQDCILTHK